MSRERPRLRSRPEEPQRAIALVIGDAGLAADITDRHDAHGYDVVLVETPLDAIQALLALGDRIGVVLVPADLGWGDGLREVVADEFPAIDRVMQVA